MSVEVNDATAEVTERIHIEVEQQVLACMARMEAHLRRRRKEQAPVLAALPAPVAQAVIVRHHENRRSDSSTGSMRIGQRSSTFSAWRSTDARTWTHSKNWFQSSHSWTARDGNNIFVPIVDKVEPNWEMTTDANPWLSIGNTTSDHCCGARQPFGINHVPAVHKRCGWMAVELQYTVIVDDLKIYMKIFTNSDFRRFRSAITRVMVRRKQALPKHRQMQNNRI